MSFYGKVGFYSLLGCLATGFDASQVRPHINSQHPNHQRRAPWGCLHSPFGLLPTPPWRANANSVKYLGRQISAYVGSHSQQGEYPGIEQRAKREGAEIHWGDETALTNTDVRGRSYAPAGKTPVALTVGGTRQKIFMIATVTNQGKTR
jgi:hypothetical protein